MLTSKDLYFLLYYKAQSNGSVPYFFNLIKGQLDWSFNITSNSFKKHLKMLNHKVPPIIGSRRQFQMFCFFKINK